MVSGEDGHTLGGLLGDRGEDAVLYSDAEEAEKPAASAGKAHTLAPAGAAELPEAVPRVWAKSSYGAARSLSGPKPHHPPCAVCGEKGHIGSDCPTQAAERAARDTRVLEARRAQAAEAAERLKGEAAARPKEEGEKRELDRSRHDLPTGAGEKRRPEERGRRRSRSPPKAAPPRERRRSRSRSPGKAAPPRERRRSRSRTPPVRERSHEKGGDRERERERAARPARPRSPAAAAVEARSPPRKVARVEGGAEGRQNAQPPPPPPLPPPPPYVPAARPARLADAQPSRASSPPPPVRESYESLLSEARGLKHSADQSSGAKRPLLLARAVVKFVRSARLHELAAGPLQRSAASGGADAAAQLAAHGASVAQLFSQTGGVADFAAAAAAELLKPGVSHAASMLRHLCLLRLLCLRLSVVCGARALSWRRAALREEALPLAGSGAPGAPGAADAAQQQRLARSVLDALKLVDGWERANASTVEAAALGGTRLEACLTALLQITATGGLGDLSTILASVDQAAAIVEDYAASTKK